METIIKILIAEHDPADLDLIQHELKRGGINYESEVVKNEADYISALKVFIPDIILCDYTFPSFSGHTAFKIKEKMAPAIPLIFVSGTIGEEKAVELIRNGVTDYVLKERLISLPIKLKRALKDAKEKKEKTEIAAALETAVGDLNKIMDSTLDVICTINKTGQFVTVSAASEWNWGYKPEELIGRPFLDLVFREDVEKTINTDKNILNGLYVTAFENSYVHKDGRIVPMIWSSKWDADNQLVYCVAKNGTEKKRLDKALWNERHRFYDLFAQAPSSIGILKGADHVYEMVNPFYLKLIGKKNIIGKTVKEVLPEVTEQGFIKILDQVYKTGEPFFANEMLVRIDLKGDGKLEDVYVNIAYQAYRNSEGGIEGIFFFTNDVTEQVGSRKKIEESEKKYRQVVETAQEGMWLINENNDTTLVNKKMCDIMGYSYKELMEGKIYHFMDDESENNAPGQIEQNKRGLSEIHNSTFISKTGKEVLVNVSTNPVFDDAGVYKGALAMITDITTRKNAEADLVKRDSQLTLAADIARLGYWEFDIQKDLFTFNNQFYAIFKTTVEQVGGYTMSSARYTELFVHPEDRHIVDKSVADAIGSADSSFCFKTEHRIIFANGETGYISVHFYIVKDEHGHTIKNYGVNQDITERKQSEMQLSEMNINLKNYTKELATSNAELEQFAFVTSHDLQEPLRMVTGFLTLIEKKYGDIIDDTCKQYIAFAVDGAKRMKQIIIDILEFSRVGRMESKLETVDLNELVKEIQLLSAKSIKDHNAAFLVDTLPVISTYKSPIRQVFQNLMSNALKFCNEKIPVRIHIAARESATHWQFSVADNGIGIYKEYFDKIFIIFQRLHSNNEFGGTGMGLAITKKIIENQGGEIWVESEEGKGSTFYFTLLKQ